MKKLLSYGGAALITAALLDPVICSGLVKPLPWLRDILMGAGGVAGLYLMMKYRKQL
jgi:hypothetical protein